MNTDELRAAFEAQYGKLVGYLKRRFAYLRCKATFDDSVAEGAAAAWKIWLSQAGRGLAPAHHGALIAKWAFLQVARGSTVGGKRATKDVLSPAAQRCRGFRVVQAGNRSDHAKRAELANLVDRKGGDPAELATALVDFEDVVSKSLPFARCEAYRLAEGESNAQVARALHKCTKDVANVRRELARQWGAYVDNA